MTDRELMQQALDAMGTVGADWICEASHHAKKDRHKLGEPCPLQQRWHIAYQALRERLAQPERTHWEGCEEVHPECRKQEPIAWVTGWHDGHCVIRAVDPALMLPIGAALYTAPQRREWVGLTEEEIKALPQWFPSHETAAVLPLIRAIEAKLREKNA